MNTLASIRQYFINDQEVLKKPTHQMVSNETFNFKGKLIRIGFYGFHGLHYFHFFFIGE